MITTTEGRESIFPSRQLLSEPLQKFHYVIILIRPSVRRSVRPSVRPCPTIQHFHKMEFPTKRKKKLSPSSSTTIARPASGALEWVPASLPDLLRRATAPRSSPSSAEFAVTMQLLRHFSFPPQCALFARTTS